MLNKKFKFITMLLFTPLAFSSFDKDQYEERLIQRIEDYRITNKMKDIDTLETWSIATDLLRGDNPQEELNKLQSSLQKLKQKSNQLQNHNKKRAMTTAIEKVIKLLNKFDKKHNKQRKR